MSYERKAQKMTETIETDLGPCVAEKVYGDDFWEITDPWGGDRFSGSREELQRFMKKRIELNE